MLEIALMRFFNYLLWDDAFRKVPHCPLTLPKTTLNPLYLALRGGCFSNFMHPSMGPWCDPASPAPRIREVLEPIPSVLAWRQGYTLDKLTVYQLLSPEPLSLTPIVRPILQFLVCGRKLDNLRRHWENLPTCSLLCICFANVLDKFCTSKVDTEAIYIISSSKSSVQF